MFSKLDRFFSTTSGGGAGYLRKRFRVNNFHDSGLKHLATTTQVLNIPSPLPKLGANGAWRTMGGPYDESRVATQSFGARVDALSLRGWARKNGSGTHTTAQTVQHKSALGRRSTNRHQTTSSVWYFVMSRGVASVLSMGAVRAERFVATWSSMYFPPPHSRVFSQEGERKRKSHNTRQFLGT